MRTPAGARVPFALIDTTGYGSEIKKKYTGMIIAEGPVSVCRIGLNVGSYAFGLDKRAPNSNDDAYSNVSNQAAEKVGNCASKKDDNLKQPRRPQVVTAKGSHARLDLGRYPLELAAHQGSRV